MLVVSKKMQPLLTKRQYNSGVKQNKANSKFVWEVNTMFGYREYYDDKRDTCDVCDEQMAYMVALGLNLACTQIGK